MTSIPQRPDRNRAQRCPDCAGAGHMSDHANGPDASVPCPHSYCHIGDDLRENAQCSAGVQECDCCGAMCCDEHREVVVQAPAEWYCPACAPFARREILALEMHAKLSAGAMPRLDGAA